MNNWIAVNESPLGFEPVYSVIDKETGRDIALNLDKEEAIKISNSNEMYDIIYNSRELLERMFLNDKNEETLKEVNLMITRIDTLLFDMKNN